MAPPYSLQSLVSSGLHPSVVGSTSAGLGMAAFQRKTAANPRNMRLVVIKTGAGVSTAAISDVTLTVLV